MSTKISGWVWDASDASQTRDLTGSRFLVLLALADIANDEGDVIFARRGEDSQPALARKARMSVATFRRVTAELQDLGLLKIERASATSTNSYRLLLDPETTAQNERWTNDPQLRVSDGTAHSYERSHRSPMSAHRDVSQVSNEIPPTPAERGSIVPVPNIVRALAGKPPAGPDTRRCKKHQRQRSNCLDCWTFRELRPSDIPWCGQCQQDIRQIEHTENGKRTMRRCPTCNPLALADEQRTALERDLGVGQQGQGKDFAIPVGDR